MFHPRLLDQKPNISSTVTHSSVQESARLPPMRIFRLGDTLIKASTRNFKMFDLQLQGPVMVAISAPQTSAAEFKPKVRPANPAVSASFQLQCHVFSAC